VNEAIICNDTIEITVEGMKGKMILDPQALKDKSFQAVGDEFESKYVRGMKYKLIDFPWKPVVD
jgi:hypothetical protein